MRRPRRLALFLALGLSALPSGPVPGQDAAGLSTPEAAARAARRLEEARRLLDRAGGTDDRIAALTATVAAYEEGLALLRDGLRRAAAERRRIEAGLEAERESIARLLGVLQGMGSAPAPVLLLHPAGPLGTARAGMMLADVTPALQAEAEALRARLEALAEIEAVQTASEATLREGLASAQAARAELAAAAADRTALPRLYTEDPVATAVLLAATETLDAFAAGLGETVDRELPLPPPEARPQGDLPLPVRGTILRRPGEADAAGIARPGLVIATEPRALVTTPVAATLRFQGPLLDLGTVAILEPAPGTLFVIAGLAQAWGGAGEVLPEGAPVGLMGGEAPDAHAILSGAAPAGDAGRSETLYLEVRDATGPIDPGLWFHLEE
ncbi:murein hydrolase activator EnvC [Rubellimicrobium sp. CFH 75288]|uniref:murein hydrolase activator EnvC family protein n=1 Tax=Rubellimicrobium sp. CFH 75288 TaxID=2697034 RepID=UPI00141322B7|nr:peptidase M23 [Rubellimicrobium sp. CFH 75288]NAZ38295.1 peptidase M23 [Rubellimicrobium sp. CFH 75288]